MAIANVSLEGKIDPVTFGNPVVDQLNATTEWIAYTPTISQGATNNITKTINFSEYCRSGPTGKTITWCFYITITGTGTAGAAMGMTLPVNTLSASNLIGNGMIYDASATICYLAMYAGSTTSSIICFSDQSTGSGWGANPSIALAVNDQIRGSITYRAA